MISSMDSQNNWKDDMYEALQRSTESHSMTVSDTCTLISHNFVLGARAGVRCGLGLGVRKWERFHEVHSLTRDHDACFSLAVRRINWRYMLLVNPKSYQFT